MMNFDERALTTCHKTFKKGGIFQIFYERSRTGFPHAGDVLTSYMASKNFIDAEKIELKYV